MSEILWPEIHLKEFLFGGHIGDDFYVDGFHCLNPDFEFESKDNLSTLDSFKEAILNIILMYGFDRTDGKAVSILKDWEHIQKFSCPTENEVLNWYKIITNQTP